MASAWITKDPTEVKEYSFDWSGQFVYDYITASVWAVSVGAGLTLSTGTFLDNVTKVNVSSGTSGTAYTITNTITTSKGKTLKQAATLTVTTK